MAKKKTHYVVISGHIPGIYDNWSEAEKQIRGYKGANQKGFYSLEEAQEFYNNFQNGDEKNSETNESTHISIEDMIKADHDANRVVVFTDGSFAEGENKASYGVVILQPSGNIELADIVKSDKYIDSRNVIGEITGVINAIQWALKNDIQKLSIYCDYEGLYKWLNGEWRPRKPVANYYVREIEKYNELLELSFNDVKSHSNISYNDQADALARGALNPRNRKMKAGNNYFKAPNISEQIVLDGIKMVLDAYSETISLVEDDQETKWSKLISSGKEKLRVTYFKNKRTLLVQGKPSAIYSFLLSEYSKNYKDYDMMHMYREAYEVTLKLSETEKEYRELRLPDNYPKDIEKLIKQSIFILHMKNRNREPDLTHYTTPAYRALEGHIRYLCRVAGHVIGERFTMHEIINTDSESGDYIVVHPSIKDHANAPLIADCYQCYSTNRNSTLHTGEQVGDITTTVLIEDFEEVRLRIKEVLELLKY